MVSEDLKVGELVVVEGYHKYGDDLTESYPTPELGDLGEVLDVGGQGVNVVLFRLPRRGEAGKDWFFSYTITNDKLRLAVGDERLAVEMMR